MNDGKGAPTRTAQGSKAFSDGINYNRFKSDFAGTAVDIRCAATIIPEPVRWVWSGYLARGKFHIAAGAPGTGKTTTALSMAATQSVGGRWPDGTQAEAGNVLVWSGEDDIEDTLLPRLLAMGGDPYRVHFVSGSIVDGVRRPFDPATDIYALARECDRIKDIRLLIVDPVSNAIAGDSHKNTEVRRGLQPVVDLAMTLDAAAIGVSHFAKGTAGRDPLERVIGSVAFGALPRVVFGCAKTTDDQRVERRVFVRSKSNIGPNGGAFEYDLIQTEVPRYPDLMASAVEWGQMLEGSARDLLGTESDAEERTEKAEAKEWLLEILGNGPMAAKEVRRQATDAGLSWRTVRTAQQDIGIKPAKTQFDGGWEWSLPQGIQNPYLKNVATLESADAYRRAKEGE